jgi:mRNA-degrading endonuclease RelE of RelBE toxin-antitoxin system
MAGEAGVYRVRVGDYRIVYEVFDDRLVVHVVRMVTVARSTALRYSRCS